MADDEIIKLYKYRTIEWSLDIIKNKRIWVSNPKSFNDPFDSLIDFTKKMTKNEVDDLSKKTEEKILQNNPSDAAQQIESFDNTPQEEKISILTDRIKRLIREDSKDIGVLSFSKTRENFLMWSHYADGHKGICIEFTIPPDGCYKIYEVKYSEIPACTINSLHSFLIANQFEAINILKGFYLTKSIDWAYEEEYRVIFDFCNGTTKIPGQISGIIFGLKTSPEDIERVKKAASAIPNIKFYECRKASDRFAVDIVEIPR